MIIRSAGSFACWAPFAGPSAGARQPIDATRNGFVLGRSAGFWSSAWDAARRRGARIYAELAGDGSSLSGYRITDSHPSAMGRSGDAGPGGCRCRRKRGTT
jgi:3-oxoacyl-(acyl-carrier-protein) synthase